VRAALELHPLVLSPVEGRAYFGSEAVAQRHRLSM